MSNLLQIHEPGQTPMPHADTTAVGIDLGTTHSVVAVSSGGKAQVIRDEHGVSLVPSVMEYDGVTVRSIKRAIGAHRMGGYPKSPIEISADILRKVKYMAEAALGREVHQAVITVPAYFDEPSRQATKDAAALAGLSVLRLISEPTAAALAYGLDHGAEGIYAIYDLGGGTFDISLLKMEKGVFQVLATGGDTQLGGDDFDALLAASSKQLAASDVICAREIKERLSGELEVDGISRKQFERLITPLIEKTIGICAGVLADAKLTKEQVKGVVLVGGSTRIPYVRDCVSKFFGKEPLTDVNPDEVVAVGAALQAEGLTQGSDNLLLDVIPLSLGLETMGGLTEKLIYRNTPIPVSVAQEFTTWQDGQGRMQIHAVQGEREMVNQNRSLARFEVLGIPPLPAGIARVKVTFTVDADGLLTVAAQEMSTGVVQKIEVKPAYGLPPEEMERMLRESQEHAKEDIIQRLLREARVEAERAIIEVESAIKADGDLLSAPERTLIDRQIMTVKNVMQCIDRDQIDVEVQQLGKITQGFAEKRMDRAVAGALKGKKI